MLVKPVGFTSSGATRPERDATGFAGVDAEVAGFAAGETPAVCFPVGAESEAGALSDATTVEVAVDTVSVDDGASARYAKKSPSASKSPAKRIESDRMDTVIENSQMNE